MMIEDQSIDKSGHIEEASCSESSSKTEESMPVQTPQKTPKLMQTPEMEREEKNHTAQARHAKLSTQKRI